jgi:hypothetical protein
MRVSAHWEKPTLQGSRHGSVKEKKLTNGQKLDRCRESCDRLHAGSLLEGIETRAHNRTELRKRAAQQRRGSYEYERKHETHSMQLDARRECTRPHAHDACTSGWHASGRNLPGPLRISQNWRSKSEGWKARAGGHVSGMSHVRSRRITHPAPASVDCLASTSPRPTRSSARPMRTLVPTFWRLAGPRCASVRTRQPFTVMQPS